MLENCIVCFGLGMFVFFVSAIIWALAKEKEKTFFLNAIIFIAPALFIGVVVGGTAVVCYYVGFFFDGIILATVTLIPQIIKEHKELEESEEKPKEELKSE